MCVGASRQALSPAGVSARGGDNPGSSFLGQMVVVVVMDGGNLD